MRLFAPAAALFAATATASASPLFFDSADESVAGGRLPKVPGKNPFYYCQPGQLDSNSLTIENVDLNPPMPKAGQELIITASGFLREPIEEGAYVDVVVKIGLIKILSRQFDLCEQVNNVDLECPIKKGQLDLKKAIQLPYEIPPAQYTVVADVKDKDGKPVTCLTGSIPLNLGSRADL